MSNFRLLAYELPVEGLVQALSLRPEMWDEITARQAYEGSAHVATKTIFIAGPAATDNILNCLDSVSLPQNVIRLSPALPYLLEEIDNIIHAREAGRIMIVKLPRGTSILPHSDTGDYAEYFTRFHLMLQGASRFRCGGETRTFVPGDLFTFNHSLEHEVFAAGDSDRIALIFDAIAPGFSVPFWPRNS